MWLGDIRNIVMADGEIRAGHWVTWHNLPAIREEKKRLEEKRGKKRLGGKEQNSII